MRPTGRAGSDRCAHRRRDGQRGALRRILGEDAREHPRAGAAQVAAAALPLLLARDRAASRSRHHRHRPAAARAGRRPERPLHVGGTYRFTASPARWAKARAAWPASRTSACAERGRDAAGRGGGSQRRPGVLQHHVPADNRWLHRSGPRAHRPRQNQLENPANGSERSTSCSVTRRPEDSPTGSSCCSGTAPIRAAAATRRRTHYENALLNASETSPRCCSAPEPCRGDGPGGPLSGRLHEWRRSCGARRARGGA